MAVGLGSVSAHATIYPEPSAAYAQRHFCDDLYVRFAASCYGDELHQQNVWDVYIEQSSCEHGAERWEDARVGTVQLSKLAPR